MDIYKEFFTDGFSLSPAGFMSPAHIISLAVGYSIMIFSAIALAVKYKNAGFKKKIRVLRCAALIQLSLAVAKIIADCVSSRSAGLILCSLPFYLCSIMFVALPVAAFAHGRIRHVASDFVFIFGMLAAIAGTSGAAYIYDFYPVLHIHTVECLLTHLISGFSAIYIGVSGLNSMKRENLTRTASVLALFMVFAALSNYLLADTSYATNYMFLIRSDGTPFRMFEALFGSPSLLYTASTLLSMWLWWGVFNAVYFVFTRKSELSSVELPTNNSL